MTERKHLDRAEALSHHYYCEDSWYSCPCSRQEEDREPVDLARCNCGWAERVQKLADQFAEVEQEARKDMVPLSVDGRSVFIDGQGEVELAEDQRLRDVVQAGDALRKRLKHKGHSRSCSIYPAGGSCSCGYDSECIAWDAVTKGIER